MFCSSSMEYVLFQSTPSAWRETQIKTYPVTEGEISIHSLRMEGDVVGRTDTGVTGIISIHSLRMEGDLCATHWYAQTTYFNPLPPHGGRLHFYLCQMD